MPNPVRAMATCPTETMSSSEHRTSSRTRVPPVRYGIDEYADHVAYPVGAA